MLTRRQKEIFDFIVSEWRSHQHTPTLDEIAQNFGYRSATGARDHLIALEAKGMISREVGKARAIRITDQNTLFRLNLGNENYGIPEPMSGIPILGQIAAGSPIEAIQESEFFLPMDSQIFGKGFIFALEVRGDSMIGAGIVEGDLAIISKKCDIESGEIAAVVIENEATLKTVIRQKQKLILRPANPSYEDIVFRSESPENVRIIGKYVGLVRTRDWKKGVSR